MILWTNLVNFSVCPLHGPREALSPLAVRLRDVSRARRRVRRADGLQRTAEVLHRKGRKGVLAAEITHLFQQARPAALQVLRAAGRKADLRYRRNGRIRTRVNQILYRTESEAN